MKTIDAGNMEWSKIPRGYLVRANGGSWSAVKDGRHWLLYWGSNDAVAAQHYLTARARKDAPKLKAA